ncbi:MAG: DUF4113 domain-containing protein [Prevotella sp.]|nr:DUF4113 domain-containing protein [Prevotella sp.]
MYYAICDCDCCYVSCERVFRPDLNHKPVVVLSNNDGCIVARSKEAKLLGIKAGMPYYQMKEQFPHADIAVFSSNYELYGELTGRVMKIIRDASPYAFRYSIDECFCHLPDMDYPELRQWGESLCRRVQKCTGLPISIGIARTKTLAKTASRFAKKFKGYNRCCIIDTDEKRTKALQLCPIHEVWGIGRKYAYRLGASGIETAYDFVSHHKDWVRNQFNIVGARTWMELNGQDCVPDEMLTRKKSICTSRSFTGQTSDYETVRTHVANFAARCAEKLRRQHSVASVVTVFIHTNSFRENLAQYWNTGERTLLTPSNSTQTIVQAAAACLHDIFIHGYQYKKAGVIVMGISSENAIQTNFIDFDAKRAEKQKLLDKAIDRLNKLNGKETIVLGSQQYKRRYENGKAIVFADAIQHAFKSKNPTTRWSDIIELNKSQQADGAHEQTTDKQPATPARHPSGTVRRTVSLPQAGHRDK